MSTPRDDVAVAYFSMEIAIEPDIPTYAGGLGVLAGDMLRGAADLGLPLVAVSLVHRQGYFRQRLDREGRQTEEPSPWRPETRLEPLAPRVTISIAGRSVVVRGWRYRIRGASREIPVYLLDTAVAENDPADRALTDVLYGGDARYRLAQEAVLGLGGVAFLRAVGHASIRTWHMNEGHSALLTLALQDELVRARGVAAPDEAIREEVRQRTVFTTHTPVPAGHDQFPAALARDVIGDRLAQWVRESGCCPADTLNMTYLALRSSRFVNGVALTHGRVSRGMFPSYPIDSITNGVHAVTWTAPSFQALYDRFIPEWRRQNLNLRYAVSLPLQEIRVAHRLAKDALLADVERRTGVRLAADVFTIGFARRATEYKRHGLLFEDFERLRAISARTGRIQAIFAGKAHPNDGAGKELIRRVFDAVTRLGESVPVVYLEEYDAGLARSLCAGVDVWLNTPAPPQEASGTSGMKAALNGVPSLSVLDGWWVEGHVENVTGWSIGAAPGEPPAPGGDAASLYAKLEETVLPTFYRAPERYDAIMRSTIALNASFFNAERMAFQYAENAYDL